MIGTHTLEWQQEGDKMVVLNVVGPPAELNKIKPGSGKVKAFISLSATHAGSAETYYQVPVQLWFSEDIHDVKLAAPKTVKVRLVGFEK